MAFQWYVGVAKQGQEKVARRELENQGFETYLPMCVLEWAKVPKIKPFLAPYIFVRIDFNDSKSSAVYSTRGLRSVLSSGDRPQPLSSWVIEEIRSREVDGLVRLPPRIQCKFTRGDVVKLKGSPLDAIFDEVVDRRRVHIFLTFLGRPHRMVVPLAKLSALGAVS